MGEGEEGADLEELDKKIIAAKRPKEAREKAQAELELERERMAMEASLESERIASQERIGKEAALSKNRSGGSLSE